MIQTTGDGAVGERARTLRPKRRVAASAAMAGIMFVGGAGVSTGAQQAAAPSTASVFHDQATKLGAKTCAGLYSALGNLVTYGTAHTVRTEASKESPDTHIVKGAVGMTYDLPELKGQAAGVVIAAPRDQGCEGQFVRVAPFQRPCQEVVGMLPAGSALAADLSGVPLYNLGGNQGQALLLASGSICTVITIASGMETRQAG